MEHLPFDIICRIADGDIAQNEMAVHVSHLNSCGSCQQEVEFQKSMIKVSHQTPLVNPSNNFVQNVLDAVNPSKKKKWFESILHNMGNIIAMASVLSFLGYVYSITQNSPIQNGKPSKVDPMIEYGKIIREGSKQIGNYLLQKTHLQGIEILQSHTINFAVLAIIVLVFIDQIAGRFFRQSKI